MIKPFTGVYYHKPSGNWRACIRTSPGRYQCLGYFKTRDRAMKQLERHYSLIGMNFIGALPISTSHATVVPDESC